MTITTGYLLSMVLLLLLGHLVTERRSRERGANRPRRLSSKFTNGHRVWNIKAN